MDIGNNRDEVKKVNLQALKVFWWKDQECRGDYDWLDRKDAEQSNCGGYSSERLVESIHSTLVLIK